MVPFHFIHTTYIHVSIKPHSTKYFKFHQYGVPPKQTSIVSRQFQECPTAYLRPNKTNHEFSNLIYHLSIPAYQISINDLWFTAPLLLSSIITMPGQAYHKKSMCIDGAEKESLARHRQVSCSSLYSLYDENDVPPEIKNITSMQNTERYTPRRARAEKRVTEIFSKESKANTAPRQKRLKPKLEPPKPGTEMDQRYLSSPVSGKQSAMYEKSMIPAPSNANKSSQRPRD
ncbi:hypothetical protein DFP73DRAFT_558289 [Morchella snyderi]|nr:hypothetical protein DFP73DRAFT_558289 [Morchella snyderi]